VWEGGFGWLRARKGPAPGLRASRRYAPLCKYLRVSALSLTVWTSGAEPPPIDVFLKAVDVIAESELKKLRRTDGD
jgi:hypothetical protein